MTWPLRPRISHPLRTIAHFLLLPLVVALAVAFTIEMLAERKLRTMVKSVIWL